MAPSLNDAVIVDRLVRVGRRVAFHGTVIGTGATVIATSVASPIVVARMLRDGTSAIVAARSMRVVD